MKPRKHLLVQILVIVVSMQAFNFDRVSPSACATAACVCAAVEQVIEICRIVSGSLFFILTWKLGIHEFISLIYFFLTNIAPSNRQPYVRALYSFDALFGSQDGGHEFVVNVCVA